MKNIERTIPKSKVNVISYLTFSFIRLFRCQAILIVAELIKPRCMSNFNYFLINYFIINKVDSTLKIQRK